MLNGIFKNNISGTFMHNHRYNLVIKLIGGLSILIGCLVSAGWAFGNRNFVTLFWGDSAMKFLTAACLVLCGTGLLSLFGKASSSRIIRYITGSIIIGISVYCYLGNFFNYDFQVNPALVARLHAANDSHKYMGRMALTTSLCFLLLGISLLLLVSRKLWVRILCQWMLHLTTLMSMIAIMGHLYRVEDLHGIPFLS